MAFLKIDLAVVAKEGQGGNFFSTSGIYPVTIKACEIKGTTNGATQANYYFKEGNSFGNNIFGIDGKTLGGGNILQGLGAILGISEFEDPEPFALKLKTRTKDMTVLAELTDLETEVWVQFKYKIYNNEIQENIEVRRFFRPEDHATGSEVESGENIGHSYEQVLKYATEVKYEDDLTPEQIEEWKKAEKDKHSSKGSTPATTGAAKKSGFPTKGSTPAPTTGFPTPPAA